MREHDVLVFLLSLAVLLSTARLLGEGARRLGFPLIFGELAAGILLGPTIFGRITPAGQHALFPGGVPGTMLAGYTNVGVVLLLVVAGLEVNLMPPRSHDQEVRILAAIARAVLEQAARERLLNAGSESEVLAILAEKRSRESLRPSRASLVDV